MEGVLVPEIWVAFAEESGLTMLKRTTRDEPDYDKLMKWRLGILKEHGYKLEDVQNVIAKLEPLEGAKEFLEAHKNMPMRAQTVSYKLLRFYMEYCVGLARCFAIKCMGAGVEAREEFQKFLAEIGPREVEFETCFDQYMMGYCFSATAFNDLKDQSVNDGIEFAAH
jgi:hypothetical protein